MEDSRTLERFDRKMDIHDLAGAIQSWGDVYVFTHGPEEVRPGIVIADTSANTKQSGNDYKTFLEEQVADGWGQMGVEREIRKLEHRVAAKIESETARINESDIENKEYEIDFMKETYGGTALGFAQFEVRHVSYIGMGLDWPWIIRDDGRTTELWGMVPKFADRKEGFSYSSGHTHFSLPGNDVFLLKSDGLIDNMKHYFRERVIAYAKEHGLARDSTLPDNLPPELAICFGREKELLLDTVRKHQKKTAVDIRDGIISDLGEYFSPTNVRDNDITFAVVKRCD